MTIPSFHGSMEVETLDRHYYHISSFTKWKVDALEVLTWVMASAVPAVFECHESGLDSGADALNLGGHEHDELHASLNAGRRARYASMCPDSKALHLQKRRAAYAQKKGPIKKRQSSSSHVLQGRVRWRRILEDVPSSSGTLPVQSGKNNRRVFFTRLDHVPLAAWTLPAAADCCFCGARRFYREPPGFCCVNGQVSLVLPRMPGKLWDLYTDPNAPDSANFRRRCRTYNNTFAFTSLGITYDPTLLKSNRAIWNELTDVPNDHPREVCVYTSSGKTHRVHYYYGCYDPLQYPLLFPYGEPGWHTGIQRLPSVHPDNPR